MIWDYFVAFIFGIVEGITEWLPVSSTGHMIILNEFMKLNVSPEFYDLYLVVIQLGAILAVIVIFWKEIWPFGVKNNEHPFAKDGIGKYIMKDKIIMWLKIALACVPAAIVGVLFDDWLDEHLYNYVVVAISLILFGIAFIVVERFMKGKDPRIKTVNQLNWGHAVAIGLFLPTYDNSITINSSSTCLNAIPVMLGASLLKILKYDGSVSGHEIGLLLVGMVTAFGVSLLVINRLMAFIRKHSFTVFGWYRIALGVIVLILGAAGVIGGGVLQGAA